MSMQLRTPLRGKALVTGTSGFIGSHVRDALVAAGAEVKALLRGASKKTEKVPSIVVDYEDADAVRRVIEREKPDYVFHVAGATKGVRYDDFRRANVVPTENLLGALERAHPEVKRFVYVSSLTAYGPSNFGPPKREADPREPVEHYGRSKREAEEVVEARGERVPYTIIRPGAVYGPAEVDLFALFRAAKLGVNLFYGNRDKRFSAVYVDDLVRAIIESALVEATRGRGYFICDGETHTWGSLQEHIARAVGGRSLSLHLPSFLVPAAGLAGELLTAIDQKPRLLNRQKAIMDAQEAWLCSHEAATRDFDYQPCVAAAEGTRRTYAWYRANRWL